MNTNFLLSVPSSDWHLDWTVFIRVIVCTIIEVLRHLRVYNSCFTLDREVGDRASHGIAIFHLDLVWIKWWIGCRSKGKTPSWIHFEWLWCSTAKERCSLSFAFSQNRELIIHFCSNDGQQKFYPSVQWLMMIAFWYFPYEFWKPLY